jgi:hypothetical protein
LFGNVLVLAPHVHNKAEAAALQYVLYKKHASLAAVEGDGGVVPKQVVVKPATVAGVKNGSRSGHVCTVGARSVAIVPMFVGNSAQSVDVRHSAEHVSPVGVIPKFARSQSPLPPAFPGMGMHTRPDAQSGVDVHT